MLRMWDLRRNFRYYPGQVLTGRKEMTWYLRRGIVPWTALHPTSDYHIKSHIWTFRNLNLVPNPTCCYGSRFTQQRLTGREFSDPAFCTPSRYDNNRTSDSFTYGRSNSSVSTILPEPLYATPLYYPTKLRTPYHHRDRTCSGSNLTPQTTEFSARYPDRNGHAFSLFTPFILSVVNRRRNWYASTGLTIRKEEQNFLLFIRMYIKILFLVLARIHCNLR